MFGTKVRIAFAQYEQIEQLIKKTEANGEWTKDDKLLLCRSVNQLAKELQSVLDYTNAIRQQGGRAGWPGT